jgi:lysozyme family protein
MTPVTTAAARKANAGDTIRALAERRIAYYRSLPTFAAFGRGWLSRVADVKRRALAMAR